MRGPPEGLQRTFPCGREDNPIRVNRRRDGPIITFVARIESLHPPQLFPGFQIVAGDHIAAEHDQLNALIRLRDDRRRVGIV